MNRLITVICILLIAFTSGCARMNTVKRDFSTDGGKGALIDIKQRAILASKRDNKPTIVCAEPSPDALSAYAAELAAKVSVPEKASSEVAAAFQEGSSFVGLRTQSIQLLRDALYRLCEGYMSGALDNAEYGIMMRRYQKYMVALLGIEQITGAIKVPAVAISTQGAAEAARSISEMREEIKSIDAKISALEEEKTKAGGDADKIKKIDTEINSLKDDKKSIQNGIKEARGVAASGSTTVTINTSSSSSERSESHLQAVSTVVKEIVQDVITTDDTGQLCFSLLKNHSDKDTVLTNLCKKWMENKINKDELEIKVISAQLDMGIRNNDKKSVDDAIEKLREIEGDFMLRRSHRRALEQ